MGATRAVPSPSPSGKFTFAAGQKKNKQNFWLQFNILKPNGHYMYHQFNIQQLYALPTLYLCVLYLSQNKQRLVPLTP